MSSATGLLFDCGVISIPVVAILCVLSQRVPQVDPHLSLTYLAIALNGIWPDLVYICVWKRVSFNCPRYLREVQCLNCHLFSFCDFFLRCFCFVILFLSRYFFVCL